MRNLLIAGAMLVALTCGAAPASAKAVSHRPTHTAVTKKVANKHGKKKHSSGKSHKHKGASHSKK